MPGLALLATLGKCLSLPPLIPSIPGVTESLTEDAPPLPILQVLTPLLESPPFTPSNTKPKEIGYFWTGSGDKFHKDKYIRISDCGYRIDDDTFGSLLWVTDVPSSGNDPHHLGPSLDGKTLVGGGLLSLLKAQLNLYTIAVLSSDPHNLQDTAFYFDSTNSYRPAFKKSNRAILPSIADEIRTKPDGRFYITYMDSAVGTSPGRLVETDADLNIIHEWSEDVEGTLNILSSDWERNFIPTSDFVEHISILKPSTKIRRGNTLRLWGLKSKKILNTIAISDGGGTHDVKFFPGKPRRTDITQDGRFIYLTLTTANHIAALDISDLNNVKRLDDLDEGHTTVGPHYVKVTPDQKHLLVTDHFVQAGEIGLINTTADFKALYFDLNEDRNLSFNRSTDLRKEFPERGGAKPHSSDVFDLMDLGKSSVLLSICSGLVV
ncbi:hypothetical protein ETB97_006694 [Aspergillus alliaceus]|uniref:Methanethiol oxidase n=1 Tax=Petromyces alliaceus TaxID=209559 RepID=A0A8H6E353_PETAA|nr:hypothetical protein ETB97_006694 [Aspergillus burnettii]